MTQNLDRLGSIQRHLSLSPNSHGKFAVSLGRRLAEYSISFGSPFTMLSTFVASKRDVDDQPDALAIE
jgi:hypothetical protein